MPPNFFKKAKMVFVRDYPRFRLGKWEHVCSHWRSAPGQLIFNFD